jgi:hypothetical protein
MVEKELLRQKVSYAMDSQAQKAADSVESYLISNPISIFKTVAASVSKSSGEKVTFGISGWVPKTNQDGGLAIDAAKMKKTQISQVIRSTTGDGFYIIRLLDINSSQVNYEYINVPLTAFNKSLYSVEKNGKVLKFISIPSDNTMQQ